MKLEELLKTGIQFSDGTDDEEIEIEGDELMPQQELVPEYHSEILEEFMEMGNDEDRMIVEEQMFMESIDDKIPDYLLNDPEVVGYPDLEMQTEIYQWAVEGIRYWDKTILDVGAGRGDLFKYISYCKGYVGVESRESLCLAGRHKHASFENFSLVNIDYFQADNVGVDVAFVIGTLNSINTKDKWDTFKQFFDKVYNEISDCCIFILNSKSDEGLNDFPFSELFAEVLSVGNIPFKIDYSKFEDIYKLTVYK